MATTPFERELFTVLLTILLRMLPENRHKRAIAAFRDDPQLAHYIFDYLTATVAEEKRSGSVKRRRLLTALNLGTTRLNKVQQARDELEAFLRKRQR